MKLGVLSLVKALAAGSSRVGVAGTGGRMVTERVRLQPAPPLSVDQLPAASRALTCQ